MQHVASRESLIATNDYLLSVADPLDDAGLDALGRELAAVADMLLVEVPLRRTVSEVTLSADARAGIITQVLSGKISDQALAVVDFAVRQVWSASRDLQESLRRVSRTAMFRNAERAGELDEVEDQLFRFSRIVDASPDLSVILDDPTADPDARSTLVDRLLAGRAHPLVTELVDALARDTAGRSFSHGVRVLVDQAAIRRQKIVAIVKTAVPLSGDQLARLTGSLGRIYGRAVSVHVEVEPSVLGGIRVQVGDEVIDGTVAGRLDQLRRRMAG
ncbi:MAG: F0F1 ATP synthase subunit delta [Nakamurella sp.]